MEPTNQGEAPKLSQVLREHHHELWIGDAAEIRAVMVRKQKTDSRDALHILDLLLTNRFPRIWVPSLAEVKQRNAERTTLLQARLRDPGRKLDVVVHAPLSTVCC
jgi:transposase